MRLIDADELLKHKTDHDMISTHLIYNMPTIEAESNTCKYWDSESHFCALRRPQAVPVRRGRWREDKSKYWSGGGAYICSVCGYGYSWGAFHEANEFSHCPNCGSRMVGEE